MSDADYQAREGTYLAHKLKMQQVDISLTFMWKMQKMPRHVEVNYAQAASIKISIALHFASDWHPLKCLSAASWMLYTEDWIHLRCNFFKSTWSDLMTSKADIGLSLEHCIDTIQTCIAAWLLLLIYIWPWEDVFPLKWQLATTHLSMLAYCCLQLIS